MVCSKVRQGKPPQGAQEKEEVQAVSSLDNEEQLFSNEHEVKSVSIFSYDANGSYIDQD